MVSGRSTGLLYIVGTGLHANPIQLGDKLVKYKYMYLKTGKFDYRSRGTQLFTGFA